MKKTLEIILFFTILFFTVVLIMMSLNLLTFGWGLGDLFYFYIQIIWVIILTIFLINIIIRKSKYSILKTRIISSILLISILIDILLFTINRGNEYPWNGKIFTTHKSITTKNKSLTSKINDTLIIKNRSAIIYEPTDKMIESVKKNNLEDFYTSADDYLFYINESNKYLKSQNIEVVMTKCDKVLKFISFDKNETIIKLNLEKEIWGIYLFDPKQKPKKIDITAITEEYKNYIK